MALQFDTNKLLRMYLRAFQLTRGTTLVCFQYLVLFFILISIDHHRSDEVWDFNSPVSRSLDNDVTTELEDRDLKDTCSLAVECARLVGRMTIEYGYLAWVAAAERAKPAGQSLMQFLNQPFWANSGGVAIAGIISNAVNGAAKCSTSNNEADLVKAAIAEAVKVNPNAGKIKATVQGPGGSWTITIEAGSNNRPTC